eukprot:scaffold128_cov328-Pavlova_lutheri.AAC.9
MGGKAGTGSPPVRREGLIGWDSGMKGENRRFEPGERWSKPGPSDAIRTPTRDPDAGIEGEGRPLAVEDAPLDAEYRSVRSVGHQPLPLRHMRNPRIIQRLRMFKPRPPRRRVPATVANLWLSRLLVRRMVYDSCSLRSSPFPVHGMGEQLATAALVEQGRKVDSLARIALHRSPQRVLTANLKRYCWCTFSFDPLEPTCCRGRCSVRTGHVTHDPKSFSEELSPFFSVRPIPPRNRVSGKNSGRFRNGVR